MIHSGAWMFGALLLLLRGQCDAGRKETSEENDKTVRQGRMIGRLPSGVEISEAIVNGWMRYIEVWILVDYKLFMEFHRDEEALVQRCISIVSVVNNITSALLIKTALKGVNILENLNELNTNDHNELLKNFTPQRKLLLEQGKKHDITVLLSGQNFIGATVGYAYVGEMCGMSSTVVVQHFPKEMSVTSVSKIFAHEIGHVLGARHDDSNCGKDNYVMTSGNAKNLVWSECSKMYIAKNIDRFSCLLNVPNVEKRFSFCGNGIVDVGEQCDCGLQGSCINPCCNPNTCTFESYATCASGRCCNLKTCKIYPVGTVCRRSASECDLPEYCSGATETCPDDVFKYNGEVCYDGKGTCFNGVCRSPDQLCKTFLSPSAKYAKVKDLRSMMRGIVVQPCEELLCLPHLSLHDDESRKIIKMRNIYFYFSTIPIIKFSIEDSTGLMCDTNKTCTNSRCTPLPNRPTDICFSDCSNSGVCNSAGRCHCDFSFSPPDCLYPGFGGSVDSEPSSPPQENADLCIYLLFLVVIPILVLTCCLSINITTIYERRWRETREQHSPVCFKCLNECCCESVQFSFFWRTLGAKSDT